MNNSQWEEQGPGQSQLSNLSGALLFPIIRCVSNFYKDQKQRQNSFNEVNVFRFCSCHLWIALKNVDFAYRMVYIEGRNNGKQSLKPFSKNETPIRNRSIVSNFSLLGNEKPGLKRPGFSLVSMPAGELRRKERESPLG
jgi:hypothetical protein